MEPKHNVAGWFEVPVENMERAIRFYEAVFDFKLSRNQMDSLDMPLLIDTEGNRIALHSS